MLLNENPAVTKSRILSSSQMEIKQLGDDLRVFLQSDPGVMLPKNKRVSYIGLYNFCRKQWLMNNKTKNVKIQRFRAT
jgi:hypothetical protein